MLSRRTRAAVLKLAASCAVVFIIYTYLTALDTSIVDNLDNNTKFEFRSEDYSSPVYSNLFQKIEPEKFRQLPDSLKCDLFFKNNYLMERNWLVDPLKGFDYKRDYHKTLEEFKKERLKKDETLEPAALEKEYNDWWDMIRHQELTLHKYFSDMRIFNKCFVESDYHSKLDKGDIARRVVPWLSGNSPLFESANGAIKTLRLDPKGVLVNQYRSHLSGKGIVLTIGDKHLDDTIRLIKLLRFLKNELPIQFIYFKNFSAATKREIVRIATSTNYMELGLDSNDEYPKQDVTFINIEPAVGEKYLHKFEGFGNKVLATVFNTFEEMILMDADTVLLVPPITFFDMKKYQEYGTAFYKDRKAVEYRPKNDLVFFKKLFPSPTDNKMFDIPLITNYTLQNDFFQGFNHYMESGLVVIDRRKHYFQGFVMSHMNCVYPVNTRVYGDKELFWLSFVLLGDERYAFNKHFSAAIGELTPIDERYLDIGRAKDLKSKELCSNHPAHVNDEDDHTLLWFNSGFRFCGQPFRPEEFEQKKRYRKYTTPKEFEDLFTGKLVITHAVIPPSKKVTVSGTDGESDRSWFNMGQYCNGYTWCAYSSIGENPEKDPDLQGLLIDYSDEEIKWFETLGDIWVGHKVVKVDKAAVPSYSSSMNKNQINQVQKENKYFDQLL